MDSRVSQVRWHLQLLPTEQKSRLGRCGLDQKNMEAGLPLNGTSRRHGSMALEAQATVHSLLAEGGKGVPTLSARLSRCSKSTFPQRRRKPHKRCGPLKPLHHGLEGAR